MLAQGGAPRDPRHVVPVETRSAAPKSFLSSLSLLFSIQFFDQRCCLKSPLGTSTVFLSLQRGSEAPHKGTIFSHLRFQLGDLDTALHMLL